MTAPVVLGGAGAFAILAKTAISTVPPSVITGDIGVSPAAATYLTGFSPTADPSNKFSDSQQVSGHLYAANYSDPTPTMLTTAVDDMQAAYTAAAGRAHAFNDLNGGSLGGQTLPPGVYHWSTAVSIPADVTLSGSGTDVWIFQVAQGLTVNANHKVILAGGASPRNIFWQVADTVNVETMAHLEGVVLCQTSITVAMGASINGRLLAQTAVSLNASTVTAP
jgi:hypothetical protein